MTAKVKIVFPAYAGVIPACFFALLSLLRVPRVCGGDPGKNITLDTLNKCSPRMRG